MLKEYSYNLRNLIQKFNQSYQSLFTGLKGEILLVVQMPNESLVCFLLNQRGLQELENCAERENMIYIHYYDLIRLAQDPSKAVRYLIQGKIKLRGNGGFIKELIEILKAS